MNCEATGKTNGKIDATKVQACAIQRSVAGNNSIVRGKRTAGTMAAREAPRIRTTIADATHASLNSRRLVPVCNITKAIAAK